MYPGTPHHGHFYPQFVLHLPSVAVDYGQGVFGDVIVTVSADNTRIVNVIFTGSVFATAQSGVDNVIAILPILTPTFFGNGVNVAFGNNF